MLKRVVFPLLVLATGMVAQKLDPIQWKAESLGAVAPGGEAVVKVTATMTGKWHLYSQTTPRPPIATTVRLAEDGPLGAGVGYQPAPVRKKDENFSTGGEVVETETFEGEVVFYLRAPVKADAKSGAGVVNVRYQACDDKQCLPPKKKSLEFALAVEAGAKPLGWVVPAGYSEVKAAAPAAQVSSAPAKPAPAPATPAAQGLGQFLLVAFGLGLAAVFTPCVFPMIPITMSYFLNQPSTGRVSQAVTFCLGIIVLFTGMGLALTAALGPFGVVQIGSNPWINGFISLIFIALGLSLLGAFEITLPSGLLSKLNSASSGGGFVGSLLMGLTFALTSFACVGPFVGTLLAASVQGDKLQPVMGMASFASGLSLPFFCIALFPGLLGKMPRSGGWLARVKIVMGFVVLALAFKYLANVDVVLQLDWLTRERFLAVWFVLFALPGLYVLGFLRLEGIKATEDVSLPRLLIGVAFLAFSFSLLPGMFCGNLGELEAYVPLPRAGTCAVAKAEGGESLKWIKNDLKAALALAEKENKPVFVNFTGYACTNCHWMKANMFTKPEVIAAMKEFVLLELYTDGTDAASEANQKLQEEKFQTVAIPYYVILDAREKVIASYPGLTKDQKEWIAFLASGRPSA